MRQILLYGDPLSWGIVPKSAGGEVESAGLAAAYREAARADQARRRLRPTNKAIDRKPSRNHCTA